MQQEGGLRKRRKRNISKVAGLSQIPYNPQSDTNAYLFDRMKKSFLAKNKSERYLNGKPRYPNQEENNNLLPTKPKGQTCVDISLLMSPFTEDAEKQQSKVVDSLLEETALPRLRQIILIGATSFVFPWSWDPKTSQIVAWTGNRRVLQAWWVIWTLIAIQTASLTFFQGYLITSQIIQGQLQSYRAIFANYLAIFWYVFTCAYNVLMYFRMEEIRNYINTLIKMHQNLCATYLLETGITSYYSQTNPFRLLNWSMAINVSQIGASVAIFLLTPYRSWYLYSYLQDYDLPWWTLIPGAMQQYLVVGNTLTNFLLLLWVTMIHSGVVSFWLEESHHGNSTGRTVDEIRTPERVLDLYKSLQILNNLFNSTVSSIGIPILKATIFFGIIPCVFVLIRTPGETFLSEFPGILTYPVGVANCVVEGFGLLSSSARMNDMATGLLGSWCRTGRQDFRKGLVALRTITVMVCGLYHIGVSTTVHFTKVTIDYVVNCVITFK